MQLGGLTSEESEIFNTKFTGFRPIEFDNLSQFGVVYEVNLDLTSYTRTVYSFLDWVSDIGGLSSAIAAFQAFLLNIFFYQALDYFMVSELYGRKQLKGRVEPEGSESNDDKGDPDDEK